ncbi:MAG: hypothetical protein R6W77_01710 [Trueperaceae bacterium]
MLFASALAQGTPSGEYGSLSLGSSVEGTLAGIAGQESVVYHTYTVTIPTGSGPVTVRIDGFGSDIDIALKFGAPILDYDDVDHLDVSEEPNPSYTITAPPAGILYVDVMNLLPMAARYRLSVTAAGAMSKAPAPAGASPSGGKGAAAAPVPNDPVVVQGSYGTLTQDNALAFIEALEFSLSQAGYTQAFTEQDVQQMLYAIAQNYPTLAPYEQAALAQAREVWTRVQANWATASMADKEEFVLGVFVLAFGEEAVREAVGGGAPAAAGGGTCDTIDACMSTYAPEAYQDSVNAQSCWSAAGCESYDPEFNSFEYESYDGY